MFKPQMALLITALACSSLLAAPPVRKFDDPGAPPFKVLKEGENPPLDANDNFVIGPKYVPAPERKKVDGVPEGKVEQFVIDSKETKLFNPGIARNEFGKVDPNNPKTLIVETHNIDYKRKITVYIPAQYKAGSESPFQVIHDGPGGRPNAELLHIFDNLIAQKRIPPIIVIWIANGGGDAQGHERGKEYDNMNGDYAEYIETEVLPRVEKNYQREADQRPRRPRGDGEQFRRFGGAHHGLVPHRSLPPRADDLGHVREPGVAVRSEVSRRGLGLPRDAHSQQPQEAHPAVHLRRRRGLAQPQRDAGRHARLGGGQPPHGQGAEGQGL